MKTLLVRDTETGKLCIQVVMKSEAATLELPADLAGAKTSEIKEYMDRVVPDMIKGLVQRVNEHERKMRRRVQ